jgi:SIT4-associating protein SAP185/190
LNIGPSRARRQLAARLALHKQQAAEAAANAEDSSSGSEGNSTESGQETEDHWQSNPFVIAGLEDEPVSHDFPSPDLSQNKPGSSSASSHTGFTPPGSPSTNSSDEGAPENPEAIRRSSVRIPLEVDDDDEEMGEMVAPGSGSGMMDSDEEDEAIINESLGYANFYNAKKFGGYRQRERSMYGDDADDHDSSDGEDDGLVEILVPGKKQSGT